MDLNVLDRIPERGLMQTGRIPQFLVVLNDVPGALAPLLKVVSEQGADVLNIAHDHLAPDLPLGRTRVEIGALTRDFEQIDELGATREAAGFLTEHIGQCGTLPRLTVVGEVADSSERSSHQSPSIEGTT